MTGFPDRLVLGPGRSIGLVETKSTVGRLRKAQEFIHRTLARLGWIVHVPRSPEDVERALREIFREWYVAP